MEIIVSGIVSSVDSGETKEKKPYTKVGVQVMRKDGSGSDPLVLYPEKVAEGLKYGSKVIVTGQARIDSLYKSTIEIASK